MACSGVEIRSSSRPRRSNTSSPPAVFRFPVVISLSSGANDNPEKATNGLAASSRRNLRRLSAIATASRIGSSSVRAWGAQAIGMFTKYRAGGTSEISRWRRITGTMIRVLSLKFMGQDMEQKPDGEFLDAGRHGLGVITYGVVFVPARPVVANQQKAVMSLPLRHLLILLPRLAQDQHKSAISRKL